MTTREKIEKMVLKAIKKSDYALIRKAMDMAHDAGIEMTEDPEYISIEDDVYYFAGAF